SKDLSDFPESPPPGLVTIPVEADAPAGADTMSGYRNAGKRAIRIDMLERLADMLRAEDSRGGFEAKPDMLSITGMTLEQFADLMEGLGYKAEKVERTKVKPVDVVMPKDGSHNAMDASADTNVPEKLDSDLAADDAADKPIMDVAAEEPAGGIIETPSDEVNPDDRPGDVAQMPDDGIAPMADVAAEDTEVEAAILKYQRKKSRKAQHPTPMSPGLRWRPTMSSHGRAARVGMLVEAVAAVTAIRAKASPVASPAKAKGASPAVSRVPNRRTSRPVRRARKSRSILTTPLPQHLWG
ncbi:helicase-like protein, partial [Sulfitobacter indolifex HEL-45]